MHLATNGRLEGDPLLAVEDRLADLAEAVAERGDGELVGEFDALLVGPTAITFVDGDVAAVAKALKEYSKTNAKLVITGGAVAKKLVSANDVQVLADLPSREVMLSQFAGLLQSPLVKTASLLQALPRNMAYGLKALVDQKEAA